ncbi:MAG: hypothetical protein ABEJ58_09845 [Halodesulfurarchaeum sp.]
MIARQESREECESCGGDLDYLEQRTNSRGECESAFECRNCGLEVRVP